MTSSSKWTMPKVTWPSGKTVRGEDQRDSNLLWIEFKGEPLAGGELASYYVDVECMHVRGVEAMVRLLAMCEVRSGMGELTLDELDEKELMSKIDKSLSGDK
jgi:hypothetical protein